MVIRFEAVRLLLPAIVLVVAGSGVGGRAQSAAPATPSVRIASITVHPGTIHKALHPNSAKITVVVESEGSLPKGAKATVAIGSYMGLPPGNDAVYVPPSRSLRLRGKRTVYTFKMRGGPKTTTGSLIVAATIEGYGVPNDPNIKAPVTESLIPIREPATPSDWQAKVKTVAP